MGYIGPVARSWSDPVHSLAIQAIRSNGDFRLCVIDKSKTSKQSFQTTKNKIKFDILKCLNLNIVSIYLIRLVEILSYNIGISEIGINMFLSAVNRNVKNGDYFGQ